MEQIQKALYWYPKTDIMKQKVLPRRQTMNLQRGMREKIAGYIHTDSEFTIEMSITGSAVYDFCCFGIDKLGMLSDDRYMIFYNQTASPANEIRLMPADNAAKFMVNLSKLPPGIDKLVFTASIDGDGTMGEISRHCLNLSQNNVTQMTMELSGTDFRQEKAIIAVEIYRKDEWRISAVANGFNGGLSALLAAYGGTELLSEPPAPEPFMPEPSMPEPPVPEHLAPENAEAQLAQKIMGKITLSKDKANLENHVVNLSKCVVSLSKESGVNLGSARAKVVVVLDYSGSMNMLYANGTVQHTINRLVPLGLTFDDNGSIDVYLFQSDYRKMADLTLSNYENYVKGVISASGYSMGGTNYAPVLNAIIEGGVNYQGGFLGFGRKAVRAEAIVDDKEPTFILFITDGENADKGETDRIILKSSGMNVFIQFIGIGNYQFWYLQQLDDMCGRKRDNTGFSNMKDLERADDNELYKNVLSQVSSWLKGKQ